MRVNFEINENIALDFPGMYIDLHNNNDFVGFECDVAQMILKLSWIRSNEKWAESAGYSEVQLTHLGVSYLKIIDRVDNRSRNETNCLGELTFFPSTERETNDSFMPHSKPNEGDDILYLFENGRHIRVHCDEIQVSGKNIEV